MYSESKAGHTFNMQPPSNNVFTSSSSSSFLPSSFHCPNCGRVLTTTTLPTQPLSCACNCFNMTKCQGDSLKLTCSVYPWSVHESTSRSMKKKKNNNNNFTLIWSLLLPLLVLPLVNAYSASSLSTSSVVNPSSSLAFKSSPVPILASGGTSSAGGRNAFSLRTNQYQETHALSSLTATSAHGYNNLQSHSQSANSITPSQFDWLTKEAIGEVKKVFYSRIQKYNGEYFLSFFQLPLLPLCIG